jgi:hypothetical protein
LFENKITALNKLVHITIFENLAQQYLQDFFNDELLLHKPINIGNPPKPHKFDLSSKDRTIVGECKNYSWTITGNVPSAKMAFLNEAAFYLSFLPEGTKSFIVLRRQLRPRKAHIGERGEALADYYYRTYKHLLKSITVFEIDIRGKIIRIVDGDKE